MLIAVRAEVESVDHWREKFKTHTDLFKSQGVSLVHMGTANDKTVIAVFDTNDVDEFRFCILTVANYASQLCMYFRSDNSLIIRVCKKCCNEGLMNYHSS